MYNIYVYRNHAGRYHIPSANWGRDGLALCKRDISRPSFMDTIETWEVHRKGICLDCMKKSVSIVKDTNKGE